MLLQPFGNFGPRGLPTVDDRKQVISSVDMIYMDMSKVFDKVNHRCLLQKFHEFGFGGSPALAVV